MTALFVSIVVTVHVEAVPVQAPLQPANAVFPAVRAVSVTAVPLLNEALQVLPQFMPDGELVTVPFELAEPVLVTVSVNLVAGGGGGGGGGCVGGGAADAPSWTMLPIDGTPLLLRRKSR